MKLLRCCSLLVLSSLACNCFASNERGQLSPIGQQKLTKAIELIRKTHYKTISEERLIEAAINGVLASMDQYSYFYDAKAFEELGTYTSGEFCGIGVEVKIDKGQAMIVSVIPGSPAAFAGIRPGDSLISINGDRIASWPQQKILYTLLGKPGTKLKIEIRRDSKATKLALIRKQIDLTSIRYKMLPQGIAYLKIGAFYENTTKSFEQAMEKVDKLQKQNKVRGFILDLRNNPGGLLEQAVNVASAFLNDGKVVRVSYPEQPDRTTDYEVTSNIPLKLNANIPLVVLINKGTISAAEVLASALQDRKRATIVGERSFGKGAMQVFEELGDGSALSITTALYQTPSGKSIEGIGITPNISLSSKQAQSSAHSKDSAIQTAIKLISTKS